MKNGKHSLKLASVLLASTLVLGACSNPFNELADNINEWLAGDGSTEEETAEESTEEQAVEDSEETADSGASESEDAESEKSEIEPKDYSHLMGEGEETSLESGTHEVGDDIPEGRYVITAETGIGNMFISDDSDRTILSTTLNGEEESQNYGSSKVLAFLEEGQSIEINGLEGVKFTPHETEEVSELFMGIWVVGEDFPAGVYEITAENGGEFGSLETYTDPDRIKARYSLGDPEYGGMSSFVASFEEGDIVMLRNYPSVKISQRD